MASHLEVVFLDVGGPLYSDRPYYGGVLGAIRELRPEVDEEEFWEELRACRAEQGGQFTRRLIGRFAPGADFDAVVRRGKELWTYAPDALQPDAVEGVAALAKAYTLGVLANQERWIREVLDRDGIAQYIEHWAVSAEVGSEKPDPGLFEHALSLARTPPERCAMIGDRLDNDIRPAKRHGMRAVWMLRGEAPDEPTPEQLGVPDASVRTLLEVPDALAALPA